MQVEGCGSEPFALRVLGDSMEPEFEHGAIIIVDPSGVVEHGAYVVAEDDEGYVFRQLVAEERGGWSLRALKEGYEVRTLRGLESIVGVVVQRAGTRRAYRKHYVSTSQAGGGRE